MSGLACYLGLMFKAQEELATSGVVRSAVSKMALSMSRDSTREAIRLGKKLRQLLTPKLMGMKMNEPITMISLIFILFS